MDKSGAGAFIFAKASGSLGKSFTGSRSHLLFEQKSLAEFWTLLFKTPVPLIPEVLLAEQIETEAFNHFFKEYVDFVNQYDNPDPVLIDQLCVYEAENLKVITSALCNNEQKMPAITDLGPFASCKYSAWPNLADITKGTQFSWLKQVPGVHELKDIGFKLDMQIVRHLWQSLQQESGEQYESLVHLFKTEYVIKNIVWALRLRIYYKMPKDDIIKKLIYVTDSPNASDPIAAPALKVLDMPLDEHDAWENWRYHDYVNPHVDGEVWQIDPSWIEKRAKVKLNKIALNVFHQQAMTSASLIGWYKIKEYELSCIRTAVESIRLNINPDEAQSAVGIQSEGGLNG